MGRLQVHVRNKMAAGALAAIPIVDHRVHPLVRRHQGARAVRRRVSRAGHRHHAGADLPAGAVREQRAGEVRHRAGGRRCSGASRGSALFTSRGSRSRSPPAGHEGIFAHVVLVPDESGHMRMLAFSSGKPIDGDPNTCCVYVPASPNPTSGRLFFVPIEPLPAPGPDAAGGAEDDHLGRQLRAARHRRGDVWRGEAGGRAMTRARIVLARRCGGGRAARQCWRCRRAREPDAQRGAGAAPPTRERRRPRAIAWSTSRASRGCCSRARGHVVLLHFWASWCGPCMRELPIMDKFAHDMKPRGLEVLSLSLDDPGRPASPSTSARCCASRRPT